LPSVLTTVQTPKTSAWEMSFTDASAELASASHPPGERAVSVLWSFGKCLGALVPVYLAGYYGFSISVVLLALMIYMGWKHSRLEKVMRLKSAMYLLENEREFTTAKVFRSKRDLPPWVNFPDVEKVEWLNKVGPFNAIYVINVEIKSISVKLLHGKLRVILEPLIGDVPLVGAITMFFIRRPKLDINWTGLTNLLDIPGLNAMSDTMIMDAIASHLVLPNRLTIPLVPNLLVAQLQSPLPRVTVYNAQAENLTAKDTVIKGIIDGKSDPYAVLRVGTQVFTSHHVDSNLNPQWREMFEVIVHEVPGQELEVEVFDKDPDQDDFLGRVKVDLDIVKKARVVDDWFSLRDVPSGSVHLRLEWLSLLSSAERLSEVIQKNQNLTSRTADPPSAAILALYLDQAHALPMRKGNKDPSPMVQISVQDTTKESKTCYGTSNPSWEDAFTFFIQDPRKQDIDIQVKDDDRALSLGSLSIPLTHLLSCPKLTMDQWFQLENSGLASKIYFKIVLRLNPMGPGGLAKPPPTRPQHATPDSDFATEGVLRIHLVEAQNLIAKDNFMGGMVKGKSDPYVKIRVAGITFKSHTIKENLNPYWNELYEVILTQLPGQEIQFELFDKDIDQDDFLGRVTDLVRLESVCISHSWGQGLGSITLPLRQLLSESGLVLDRWFNLDGALPESQILLRVTLKVHITYLLLKMYCFFSSTENGGVGQVKISIGYSMEECRLFITVHACRALAPCSKDGADPYVSFVLLPDKKATTKRRTATKKRDLNPEFNERFDFDFSLEESAQRRLDLSVKHNVSFISREKELIGKMQLDLDQIDLKNGVTQWYLLYDLDVNAMPCF
uniref:Extended synaptotagmin-like protein 1a n=1 Tax=Neogobius melanostomus TaxID=47308 RepID=A0A8C6WLD3_9GOBI